VNRSRRTPDRGPDSRRPSRGALQASSDEQLVELVLDGRDEAFEVLFERHVADSLWYAREVLGTWGEAEEAVRHSFAAAHAYLATRGRETEFAPWLHTILGNYCLSILHSRTPSPRESAVDATVVDLGEWRLRRKLFGVALPVAPGAALRDSVMAACGIGAGAGAATTGTPLLGGMLAKVAVVAVLAGGAGVAADVAPDRAAPAGADSGVRVEQTVDSVSGSSVGVGSARERAGQVRGSPGAAVRELDGAPRAIPGDPAPRDKPRAMISPTKPSTATSGDTATKPLPAPDSTTGDRPVTLPLPVQPTLRSVVDHVKDHVPVVGDRSESRPLGSIDLAKIRDDLGVTAVESPVDVRTLLSQGTSVLPSE
jgi:hypothetical protein